MFSGGERGMAMPSVRLIAPKDKEMQYFLFTSPAVRFTVSKTTRATN